MALDTERDFPGNPNPTPKSASPSPVVFGVPQPAGAVTPQDPVKHEPVDRQGSYWVTPRKAGEQTIFFTTADGEDREIGKVYADDASELLDKAARRNPLNGAWYDVPEEVAMSLKNGNLPLTDFLKGMYANGEIGHRRGMLGTQALRGGMAFSEAAQQGDDELLKTTANERPQLWGKGMAGLLGNARWAAGTAVEILPGVIRGAGAGAQDSATVLAGLGAATLATGGLDAPATIPLAASAVSLGMTNGIIRYTMETEGGNLALDMYKRGFKEETIKKVAPAAGAVIGLLETAQFKFLAAPLKKIFVKKVLESGPVKTALVDWVKNTTGETATELAQEAVSQATANLSALYEGRPELLNNWDETKKAFTDTLVKSFVGMGVIGVPGAAVQAYGTSAQRANVRALKAQIKETEGAVAAPAAEKAIIGDDNRVLLDAKKLNEGLAKERSADELKAAGRKLADNDSAKAALHAMSEARKIELESLAEEDLAATPESQKRAVRLAQEIQDISLMAEGVKEGEISAAQKPEPLVPQKEPKTPVEYAERRYTEQTAVLKNLERESAVLDKELTDVNSEIDQRIQNGQATAALSARAAKLAEKLAANDAQAADIIMTPMGAEEELAGRLEETGAMGLVRAADLARMEQTVVDRVRKARETGERSGAAYAKREVKRVQKYISELIKRSSMTDSQKKHFDGVLRNTQTVEQLERNYPEIRDRIFEAEDAARAKAMEAFLKRELKSAKPAVGGKTPMGKLGDPDTQALVSVVTKVTKLPRREAELLIPQAEDELLAAEDETRDGYSPLAHAKAAYQLRALQFRANRLSPKDAASFIRDITGMIEGARAKFLEKKLAEREAFDAEARAAVKDALGGIQEPQGWEKARVESFGWVKGAEKAKSVAFASSGKILDNIWSAADLLNLRGTAKTGKSWFDRVFDPSAEAIRKDGIVQEWHDRYTQEAAKAYGFTGSEGQKAKMLRRMSSRWVERHDLGEFKNAKGQKVSLNFSVQEAIKFYMERQDPTLAENLFEPEGNAYTPEMERAITGLLLETDKAFALGQLKLYREMYAQVNAVYRKVRGVDLPFNEFYSPIRAIGFKRDGAAELTPEGLPSDHLSPRTTLGNWSINRVRHLLPLEKQSAEAAFNKHVHDIAHFIAYEEKVRLWNRTLAHPYFRAFVTGVYGSDTLEALDTMVRRVTSGTHEQMLMRGFNRMITNLAVAEIIGKGVAVPKQLSSMPAFMNALPIQHLHLFVKNIGAVLKDGFPEEWVKSDFVKSRGMSQTQELRAREEWAKSGSLMKNPSIVEFLSLPIKWGDKVSILVGGGALYRTLRETGMSAEDALALTSKTARDTQSTGSVDSLSVLQSAGGVARLLTLYMNQPVQFVRLEMQAIRAITSKGFAKGEGRMTRTEVVKTLMLFHVVIPMIFQAVVDAGWDEERQKRAAILGSFNSVPLISELILNLYHRIMKDNDAPFGGGTIYDSFIRDLDKGVKELTEAGSLEDFAKALAILSDPVFKAVWSIPTKPLTRLADALDYAEKDDFLAATKIVAGYSPYMVKDQKKREGGDDGWGMPEKRRKKSEEW